MILDEPYEGIIEAFNGNTDKISELVSAIVFVVSNAKYPSYFSREVPDVKDADLIVFVTYRGRYGFLIKYKNGNSYLKEFKEEEVGEYVFTPCLLDLVTLTPVNK